MLFGGARKPHRSIPRIPLPEREWEKPPGAGNHRGWDLVRFALFGENGPHLKRPIKNIVDDEKVKGADDSSSSGEESESAPAEDENNEKKPAKVGFVHVRLVPSFTQSHAYCTHTYYTHTHMHARDAQTYTHTQNF